MQETINLIVSRMNVMSDEEREQVLCALLNRYCVGCGRAGDWSNTLCDCEPRQQHTSCDDTPPRQLWLTYNKAA